MEDRVSHVLQSSETVRREQSIPFVDLVSSHRELEPELLEAVREALRSAAFIGGPQVEAFEREFAGYCGSTFCVGVGSGTDALRFALIACGVTAGDAVVTVANTFIATVEAISQAGADTEFVDVDERTYTMDPAALERFLDACPKQAGTGRPLGQRTGKPIKAVVPVHLYGQLADMEAINAIAARHGLLVIEDACQAHGAQYRSGAVTRRAGSIGIAAGFSFYPGKNLGACGEAGAVTTNDERVARAIRMIRDHGQSKKYYHAVEGYNGRLDAIQAAILRIKLRHLDAWTGERRAAAARYHELLQPLARLHPAVVAPHEPAWSRAVYHLYVIQVPERDALAERMLAEGIHTGLHYPVPLHLQECYRHLGWRPGALPVTERVASRILSLPMFPGLTLPQQERVAAAIEAFMAVSSV
jgi:dTDP-4-amino-4,6-dideoxygalactose transaminase